MHFDSTASELAEFNVPLNKKRHLSLWDEPFHAIDYTGIDSQTCNNQEKTV